MSTTPSGATSQRGGGGITMTAVQLDTSYNGAIRFPAWIALAIFSGIALAAAASELDSKDRGSQEKFTLAVTSVSMCISILAMGGYLVARAILLGTIVIEAVMVALLLGLWGPGLFVIMAPDNGIAVVGTVVSNANLYFSSWVCFAILIFLSLSLLQEYIGIDATKTPGKQAKWFFLLASSLVVMGTAARLLNSDSIGCDQPQMSGSKYCKRTKFAISLGVVSCAAAMGMSFLIFQHMAAAMIELGVTTVLLIMWTFGAGFITFGGSSSPGTTIGNLYFSTWISFVICVMLFASSFQEFLGMSSSQSTATSQSTNGADPELDSSPHHNNGEPSPSIPNEEDF